MEIKYTLTSEEKDKLYTFGMTLDEIDRLEKTFNLSSKDDSLEFSYLVQKLQKIIRERGGKL
jgi:hypothetical protein